MQARSQCGFGLLGDRRYSCAGRSGRSHLLGRLLSADHGSAGIDTAHFTAGLAETEATWFDGTANFCYFNVAGPGHVLWTSPSTTTGTTSVQQFITRMVNDDPGWASVTPP